jgi:phosphoribosyl 1,2-cyclic phosphodiesterase
MAHNSEGPTVPAASATGPAATSPPIPAIRAICWGTRGSIPTPGRDTAGFGGNTSCLEVVCGEDRRLIFDAGTGIRLLGRKLASEPGATDADLFLTHFHWDHIQGLPFFAPLFDEAYTIRVHAPRQGGVHVKPLFAAQMEPYFFPVPYSALAATIEFEEVEEAPWELNGVRVEQMRVRHAGNTFGYRVGYGDRSIAYVPDNELIGGDYPLGEDWYGRLVAFLRDVDVLFHDAMFTEAEYPGRTGWGHSTFHQAIRLAQDAGVRRLCFFHHAPERSDAELRSILDELRNDLARQGSPLVIDVAAEGHEILVQEHAT